ncbi:hypothetical protein H2203_005166 [Taxawa tesnikishii (nom. ined.)]|nr:hypothetical protein H2203_005166 [Dothideales sp. JES 119]
MQECRYGHGSPRLGDKKLWIEQRFKAESLMINDPADTFKYHGGTQPQWFTERVLRGPNRTAEVPVDVKGSVLQAWIAKAWGARKKGNKGSTPARSTLRSQTRSRSPTATSSSSHRNRSPLRSRLSSSSLGADDFANLNFGPLRPGNEDAMDVDDPPFVVHTLHEMPLIIVVIEQTGPHLRIDRNACYGQTGAFLTPDGAAQWDTFTEFLGTSGHEDWPVFWFNPWARHTHSRVDNRFKLSTAVMQLWKFWRGRSSAIQLFLAPNEDTVQLVPYEEKVKTRLANNVHDVVIQTPEEQLTEDDLVQQRLANEDAQRLADEEAQRLADEEARRLADEEAQRLADEEAQRLADEEAQRLADEEAQRFADEEAQRGDKERDVEETGWPWMIPATSDDDIEVAESPTAPSIDLSRYNYSKNEALSSAKLRPEIREGSTEEALAKVTDLKQIDVDTWNAVCRFFGHDPTNTHPRSGVFFPGWKRSAKLLSYQFYTVGWLLKRLLQGSECVFIGHSMGMGKTAIVLALLKLLAKVAKDGAAGVAHPLDSSFHLNPNALTQVDGPLRRTQSGPMLVITPTYLSSNWVNEWRKFSTVISEKSTGVKMILMLPVGLLTNRAMESEFKDCYRLDDVVRPEDLPPREQLVATYGSEEDVPTTITAKILLEPNASHKPEPWQSEWCVLTTQAIAVSKLAVKVPGDSNVHGEIYARWSVVAFDEYHTNRNPNSSVWSKLAYLPGDPNFIFISGTPFPPTLALVPPLLAAHARYYEPKSGTKFITIAASKWTPSNARTTNLPFRPNLAQAKQRALSRTGFIPIAQSAAIIDKAWNKKNKLSDAIAKSAQDKEDEEDEEGRNTKGAEKYMIRFPTELWWQVDPNSEGQPALDFPPHATWDQYFDIDEKFRRDGLGDEWLQSVKEVWTKTNKHSEAQTEWLFFQIIRKFRIWTVFPCLYTLMENDDEMKAELNKMDRDDAARILKGARNSTLWSHMHEIDQLPPMMALKDMIAQIRGQLNFFKRPRKIIIAAFVPFNVMVVYMYLLWLVGRPNYTAINDEKDIALVASWNSQTERDEQIANFKTTTPSYKEQPGIMVASATQIAAGLSLDPADVVIIVDPEFDMAKVEQVMARVRRMRLTQRLPTLKGFV